MENSLLRFTHRVLLLSTLTTVLLGLILFLIALFEIFGSDFFHQWMMIESDGSLAFLVSSSSNNELPKMIESSILAALVQAVFISFAWLMVQLNALKVFRALKDSETFHLNSIKALRTVGFWLFIITAIELLQFKWIENTFQITLNFEFTYLIAACSAMVLAQIFKEGNELAETNRLTI
jgi:hypothetical protein